MKSRHSCDGQHEDDNVECESTCCHGDTDVEFPNDIPWLKEVLLPCLAGTGRSIVQLEDSEGGMK